MLILGLIALLMIADAFFDGSNLTAKQLANPIAENASSAWSIPMASMASWLLPSGASALETIARTAFWIHNIAILCFLNLLPMGKHFHVITALPNVFLSNLQPGGKIKPPSYSEDDFDALETVGVSKLEDFRCPSRRRKHSACSGCSASNCSASAPSSIAHRSLNSSSSWSSRGSSGGMPEYIHRLVSDLAPSGGRAW